jgi:hypothetical protein
MSTEYVKAIAKFVKLIKGLIYTTDFGKNENLHTDITNVETITQWVVQNLGSIVASEETGVFYSSTVYKIKTDKVVFDRVIPNIKLDDGIEELHEQSRSRLDLNVLKEICFFISENTVYGKAGLLKKNSYTLQNENGDDVEKELNSNTPDTNREIIEKHNIKTFVGCSIIIQSLKKSITNTITDICASDEKFMHRLLELHDAMVTNIQNAAHAGSRQMPFENNPFTLKGGNTFKLHKRNYNIANNIDNPISLSDWDFTVNLHHGVDYHHALKEYMGRGAVKLNSVEKKICTTNYYSFLQAWIRIKNELGILRDNLDVTRINDAIFRAVNCVIDPFVGQKFNLTATVKDEDDILQLYQNSDGPSIIHRDRDMHTTRNVNAFKQLAQKKSIKGQFTSRAGAPPSNRNVRILDMEIYNLVKIPNLTHGTFTMSGFDLIRLGLCYQINFTVDDVNISFTVNSELLDYGYAKPFTIDSHLHPGDAQMIDYVPMIDGEYKYGKAIQVHSYGLRWFINDILQIIYTNVRQPKHEKRLRRIEESLSMMRNSGTDLDWLNETSFFSEKKESTADLLTSIFDDDENRVSVPNVPNNYSVSIPQASVDRMLGLLDTFRTTGGVGKFENFLGMFMGLFIVFLIIILILLFIKYYNKELSYSSDDCLNESSIPISV